MDRWQCPICKRVYPWKLCLIKYELDIHVFLFFKLFIFIHGFSATCAFLAVEMNWTLFESGKRTFHIFDQIKVSRVPLLIGKCHFLRGRLLEIMLTVPLTGFLHFTSPCPILSLIKSNFVLSNIESPSWTLPLELGKGSVIHSNFPTFIFQGLLSFLQIIGYYIELSSSFNANNTHIA